MMGYTVNDIAELSNRSHQSVSTAFSHAVKKICQQDNENWLRAYGKRRGSCGHPMSAFSKIKQ